MRTRVATTTFVAALAALLGLAGCSKQADSTPEQAKSGSQGAAVAPPGADKAAEQPAPAPKEEVAAGLANIPRKGPADAKVVLIESSDFQCPFCSRAVATIKQIHEAYPNDVAIYFFQNPLNFHPNALPAAKAAMAANKQGKFWEMHDKLFENQRELSPENYLKWAGELGLNMDQFKEDMNSPATEKEIKRQQGAMVALGARGTPGFFVNGEQLKGAQPFETFKATIDKQLAATKAVIEGGTPATTAWQQVTRSSHSAGDNFIKWVVNGEEPPAAPEAPAASAQDQKPRGPAADQTVWKVPVDPNDPMKGGKEPLVTIVQFSEFQCPFCSRVAPTIDQIVKAYGDDVAVVFKHNPLPFHNNAVPASLAAMAAQDQGKFWEMHDKLFANQRALEAADLEKYASEVGLDLTKFKESMANEDHKKAIEEDQKLAASVNARGTPNTYVNGRQVTGAQPFEAFKQIIDEELAKAKAKVDAGTPRAGLYAEIIKDGKVFKALDDAVIDFKIDGSPVKGSPTAKVKIYEFSDFQCPFCSRVGPVLEEVKKHYGDDVAIIFKQFPLSFHQNAQPAAKAALAAFEQGKFWEMHDLLFANQKELSPEKYEEWAKQAGVDVDKWKVSMADAKWEQKLKDDMEEGTKAGVRGTPTVFINGRKFQPTTGYNLQAFTSIIDSEILGQN